jgi:hypothetical protein
VTRWRWRVLAGLCAALTVACDRESLASVSREVGSHVAGKWTARLTLDRLPILAGSTARLNQTLFGTFAFVASTERSSASGPAAYGVYDIDFTGLGLPRSRGVPAATLRALHGDSLEIRLDGVGDQATMVLRGELGGDSIVGTWGVSVPRVTEGGGRFAMVHTREE